ncbi:MAG: hypothetical protein RL220_1528 [Bacteroidota bacterium]
MISLQVRLKQMMWMCVIAAISLVSCRSAKESAVLEPIKDRSAGFLLKRYERNEFKYDYAGMKLNADLLTLGETQGFKANVRMKYDSAVWISISPALGIEVVRCVISNDSVKYVSKIPENKHYYLGGFDVISEVIKADIGFTDIQDILLGNAIGLERDEGKFRTSIDENKYLLVSKYRRKVRKAVGVDDKDLSPDDTIVVNMNDRKVQRAVKKSDDEDLVISRYWLEPENYRLVKSVFNDILNQRTIEIQYSEFKQEGEQYYPSKCRLIVRDQMEVREISFEITKLNVDKTYDFPFEIPQDYERKNG